MRKIIICVSLILVIILIVIQPKQIEKNISKNNDLKITLPYVINTVAKRMYLKKPNYEKLFSKSNFNFKNNDFYNSITGLVGNNTKKIIDISSYQKDIDWDKVSKEIDGVIVRIGFGSNTLDNKLEKNIKEIKRLKIPYGIYLYSYAENKFEALKEAEFTKNIIKKYDLNPTLGVYYDIEQFSVNGKTVEISKNNYQKIIETYINYLDEYDTSIYTYAKIYNRYLNDKTKKYVTWIAQYNYYFEYQENFKMWQYSSNELVDGIEGYVDMNVMFDKE